MRALLAVSVGVVIVAACTSFDGGAEPIAPDASVEDSGGGEGSVDAAAPPPLDAAAVDAGPPVPVLVATGEAKEIVGLAIDDARVLWLTRGPNTLSACAKTGCPSRGTPLRSSLGYPTDLGARKNEAFIALGGGDERVELLKADGSNPVTVASDAIFPTLPVAVGDVLFFVDSRPARRFARIPLSAAGVGATFRVAAEEFASVEAMLHHKSATLFYSTFSNLYALPDTLLEAPVLIYQNGNGLFSLAEVDDTLFVVRREPRQIITCPAVRLPCTSPSPIIDDGVFGMSRPVSVVASAKHLWMTTDRGEIARCERLKCAATYVVLATDPGLDSPLVADDTAIYWAARELAPDASRSDRFRVMKLAK